MRQTLHFQKTTNCFNALSLVGLFDFEQSIALTDLNFEARNECGIF